MADRLLVIGDSLCFHGPRHPNLLSEPRLWPNIAAATLGAAVPADTVAREGWTSRDGWWAMTKDPRVWTGLADARALVIAVGSMDQMPASLPVWLRESIRYVRPGGLRRRVRTAYHRVHPPVVRLTGGRWRQLPQRATDHYLSRMVAAVRHLRPDLPVGVLTPIPWRSAAYPSARHHSAAVAATKAWAHREDVRLIDVEDVVARMHASGAGNPDGLHWDWATHEEVGRSVATALS